MAEEPVTEVCRDEVDSYDVKGLRERTTCCDSCNYDFNGTGYAKVAHDRTPEEQLTTFIRKVSKTNGVHRCHNNESLVCFGSLRHRDTPKDKMLGIISDAVYDAANNHAKGCNQTSSR